MKKCFVLCIQLLVLSGCYLGDRRLPSHTVSLALHSHQGQTEAQVHPDDSQVKEALKIVDEVLVETGYVRDADSGGISDAHFLVRYSMPSDTGLRAIGGPRVYLWSDRMDVVIVGGGNMNAPTSAANKKLCNSLRETLVSKYGRQRVRVK